MWSTDAKLIHNQNPLKLPEINRERWSLRAATWQEYNDNEPALFRPIGLEVSSPG